jgi:hypothetical protein
MDVSGHQRFLTVVIYVQMGWLGDESLDGIMRFNEITVDAQSVGTAFMPSGDSSPCTPSTRLLPGFVPVHGDESPDAINAVSINKPDTLSRNISGFNF